MYRRRGIWYRLKGECCFRFTAFLALLLISACAPLLPVPWDERLKSVSMLWKCGRHKLLPHQREEKIQLKMPDRPSTRHFRINLVLLSYINLKTLKLLLQIKIISLSSKNQVLWCEKRWFKVNSAVFADYVQSEALPTPPPPENMDWRNGWIQVQRSQYVCGTFWNVSVLSWSASDCCLSCSRKSLFCLPMPSLKVNFSQCSLWHLSLFSAALFLVLWQLLLCFYSRFFPGQNVSLL